ncbi:MAG TPA: 5,10-methylenetetrahydrofolate reductase, partial [Desulfobacteraceae bacterium]|nr:5,10-methylenetetrahydrofolate reductase [Desulfobacteraceae bacterium]
YNTFDLIKLVKKMNSGLDYNDKEFGGKTDFAVSCTATPVGKKTDAELERMSKKIDAGADFFQTQVVYDAPKTIDFLKQAKPLGKPLLVGLMPLKSVKMARFMTRNVDGIDVPDEVIHRMETKGATGIDIACDFIRDIIEFADGIHIMAMGDVAGTNKIIEFTRALLSK